MARNPKTKQVRAAEGPYKALLDDVAAAGEQYHWSQKPFLTCKAVKAVLNLERPAQREALLALFHEIGMEASRIDEPRTDPMSWCNLNSGRGPFNSWCVVASLLLRRELGLTRDDWLGVLGRVGAFEYIKIGLSHDYMNSMVGRLEKDAKLWTDLPRPLSTAIRKVAKGLMKFRHNAPQVKMAERLSAIIRRFDVKAERAAVNARVRRAPLGSPVHPAETPQGNHDAETAALLRQLDAEIAQFDDEFPRGSRAFPSVAALQNAPANHSASITTLVLAKLYEAHKKYSDRHPHYDVAAGETRRQLVEVLRSRLRRHRIDSARDLDLICTAFINGRVSGAGTPLLIQPLLRAVELFSTRTSITPTMIKWLKCLRTEWGDVADPLKREQIIRDILGEASGFELDVGEPWAARATEDMEGATASVRGAWASLVDHGLRLTSASPSGAWFSQSAALLKIIGRARFEAAILDWLPLVREGRTTRHGKGWAAIPAGSIILRDQSQLVLRGLCWAATINPKRTTDLARALGALVLTAYRKVPGRGPAAVMVGNAAIGALGRLPGPDALAQLAMLRVKVKFGTGQKMLEKALDAAASRHNLPRSEIEELAVPGYGMTEVGVRREELGDFVVEVRLGESGGVETVYAKRAPEPMKWVKSPPAALKGDHAEELKELKASTKDMATMLSAQRDRIDALFAEQKSWPLDVWRDRYLNHPVVGLIARRLLWSFITESGSTQDSVWLPEAGSLVDASGKPFAPPASATVRLWHPIARPVEEVVAWRRFFEERQIRQPFKQAHREVYVLTDAERRTETYSNRFAAHILRQHQFNALAAARGWKNRLRLMVDDEYPPAFRVLSAFGLRAEFWIEGAGDEYGVHTNEAGVFNFVSTDQVRFYRAGAAQPTAHAGGGGYWADPERRTDEDQPLPLAEVPALALSEVLRDVDLFVGVASIGNNPEWVDGGPQGGNRDYWWRFSFGEMTELARSRLDLLSRLLPRLKIAPVCRIAEPFLVVRGSLRTYKIHLGSGNILMEPNDEYLCIVPSRSGGLPGDEAGPNRPGVFLPFEGDRTLSIILSKAFMLAADDQITDLSITRQIRRT